MEGQTPGPDAPKTLEEAQRQTESKWSLTMDEMETSRNTHGFYFARFGSDISGWGTPSRALVIKDRIKTAEGEGWVFITRDGPKFLSTENPAIAQGISEKINQRIQEEIELVSNGQPFSENVKQEQGWAGRTLTLGNSLDGTSAQVYGIQPSVKLSDIPSLDIVQLAVDKSRENAEMPKKRIEDQIAAEQAKTVLAQDVTSFIKDLPPKT